jgi:hypothetical protein
MLAARSFRITIALVACFNLEIKQFDIVNTFINIIRDTHRPVVAYKLPNRFKAPRIYIEVN